MSDWLNWFSTVISSLAKEGLTLTTVIIILAALLKVPWIQRAVIYFMPKRFKPRHHTSNTEVLYELRELRQAMEESKWHADLKSGENEQSATTGVVKKSSLQLAESAHATTAASTTPRTETYPYSQRRIKKMNTKSKWLSRKFLMAVISAALVICNDGLNLGLDQSTIIAFGSIVVGWIVGEAAVDVSKKTPAAPADLTVPIQSEE